MKVEWMILYAVWATTFSLLFFIPRKKFRIALAAIFFKQTLTWIIGLVVVEKGWIEYPVREFSSVNRSSFTFEFMTFPVVCGLFNAHFPENKSLLIKLFYYGTYSTILTVAEVLLEKNTNVIKYHHWSWYYTWITLLITFIMSRIYCKWFFKNPSQ